MSFWRKNLKKLGQRDKKLKYPLNYSLIRKFRVTYKNSIKENGLSNFFFFPLSLILSFAYKSFIKPKYKGPLNSFRFLKWDYMLDRFLQSQ